MNNAPAELPKVVSDQTKYPPINITQIEVRSDIYEALENFYTASVLAQNMPYAKPRFQRLFTLIARLCQALLLDLIDRKKSSCECCVAHEHTTKPEHRHHLYDVLISLSTTNITAVITGLLRALIPSVNKDFFQIAINILRNGRKPIEDECRDPTDIVLYMAMSTFHSEDLKSKSLEGCGFQMAPYQRAIIKNIVSKNDILDICILKGGGYSYADDQLKNPQLMQVNAWYNEFFIGGALLISEVLLAGFQIAYRPEYNFLKTFLVNDVQCEILSLSSMLIGQQIDKNMNDMYAYPITCMDSQLNAAERTKAFNDNKTNMTRSETSRLVLCEWMKDLGYSYDWIAIHLLEGLLIRKTKK